MMTTNRSDGIYLAGHGIVSVEDMCYGLVRIDPLKLGTSLAKINRFAGNSKEPWKDAEHSMLVAQLVNVCPDTFDGLSEDLKDTIFASQKVSARIRAMALLWALLHDVVEVIVGDTPKPVKLADVKGRYDESVEDRIEHQLLHSSLSKYALRLAESDFSHMEPANVEHTILKAVRAWVKNADALALLVEVDSLHEPEVFKHICHSWRCEPHVVKLASSWHHERLVYQSKFGGIDWRTSAQRWHEDVVRTTFSLDQLFCI